MPHNAADTVPARRRNTPARPGVLFPTAMIALVSGAALAGESEHDYAAMMRAESAAFKSLSSMQDGPQPFSASLLLQTRYMLNIKTRKTASDNAQTIGFSMPRAQLRLDGNLINRQLTGHLTMDFGDAEGDRGRGVNPSVPAGEGAAQLREAYVQYNFEGGREGLYIKVGQFKSSLLTEDAIAPEYQLAVERSVSNEFFALGLTQGLALGKVTDRFAWEVTLSDGYRYLGNPEPANTAFNDTREADWAVSGRLDWKLAGDWARFADFTSWRGSDEGLKIGAGFSVQGQGSTNPDQVTSDFLVDAQEVLVLSWAADVQYESDGWAVFAAYHGQWIELETDTPAVSTLKTLHHGFVLQASYFVGDRIEVFGRYDAVHIDHELSQGFSTTEEQYDYFTVGVNWYMIPESHAVKFTADASITRGNSDTFDTGNPSTTSIFYPDATVTGFIGDSTQEVLFRGQMQVLF